MEGKASEFRREARKLRRAANETKNQITGATLVKLAEEYERMARHPVANYPKILPGTRSFISRSDFKI
jgi:hypothetical protein